MYSQSNLLPASCNATHAEDNTPGDVIVGKVLVLQYRHLMQRDREQIVTAEWFHGEFIRYVRFEPGPNVR